MLSSCLHLSARFTFGKFKCFIKIFKDYLAPIYVKNGNFQVCLFLKINYSFLNHRYHWLCSLKTADYCYVKACLFVFVSLYVKVTFWNVARQKICKYISAMTKTKGLWTANVAFAIFHENSDSVNKYTVIPCF